MAKDRYFNYKKSQIEGFVKAEFQKKFLLLERGKSLLLK